MGLNCSRKYLNINKKWSIFLPVATAGMELNNEKSGYLVIYSTTIPRSMVTTSVTVSCDRDI